MAKVMISIPDELLKRVDRAAGAAGETRSGFLQRLAERELQEAQARRREEVNRLLDQVRIEPPSGHPAGLDIVRAIREGHESH